MKANRWIVFVVIAILLLTLIMAVSPAVATIPDKSVNEAVVNDPEWTMFHHDLSHTGTSPSTAPNTNHTLWNYATSYTMYWSSPAVAAGKVFIGSGITIQCLDANNGSYMWSFGTGNSITSSPAVVDGKVYAASQDGSLYCFSTVDGAYYWNYATGSWIYSSPAVADGKVYIGSNDQKVYCLNASTGKQIWNYTTGSGVSSSPAVVGDVVYIGSEDHNVYALNAATGAKIWNFTAAGSIDSSPAVDNGIVYIGSDDGHVYALNAGTGAQIWSYATGGLANSFPASPAVANGKVYVGFQNGNISCLDASDGTYIWNYTTGGIVHSSPAVVDGKVCVGSDDGKVYCLEASSGALVWSYQTGSPVWSSPAVVDGKVYIGSNDKKVYCFGLSTLTTTITPSSADTYTNYNQDNPPDYSANTNFGNQIFIEVLTYNHGLPLYDEMDGFVMFDVSSKVPTGSTIISATLSLYDTEGSGASPADFSVYRVDSAWNESTLTWNTNPTIKGTPTDHHSFNPSDTGYHQWDVTADVKSFVSGTASNYGWCLRVSTGSWATFASKEGAAGELPQLAITWHALSVENIKTWYWTNNTVINSVARGDVDANGYPEIVTGGNYNDGTRNNAQLCVWNGATMALKSVKTWYWTSNTQINSVAVGDVDADGKNEIVTGGLYNDGTRDVAQLCVWDGATLTLENVKTWYWSGNTRIFSVSIGNVDGDSSMEIVTGGSYFDGTRDVAQLCVWDGATLTLENVKTWYWSGNTRIFSVSIGNVDGDSSMEIVTGGSYFDGTRINAQLCVWNGATLALENVKTWYWTSNTQINSVSVGDVDGDGSVEIVTGGHYSDGSRDVAQLCVWNGATLTLENLKIWYWTSNTDITSIAVGDVDGDAQMEIVTGGFYNDGTRNIAQLCVWNGATLTLDNVKIWYWTSTTVINSVAIGDVNADGKNEITAGGYYNDGTRNVAQLVVWS